MEPTPHYDGIDTATRIARVRLKVAAGSLPATPCTTLWGRRSRSAVCEGCQTLTPPAVALECRDAKGKVFVLCHACFGAWVSVVHAPNQGAA